MGTTHKLKPAIINYILSVKKNNTSASCRTISRQIKSKFKVDVSKSSVNSVLKRNTLSGQVGRKKQSIPAALEKPVPEMGVFFLKAADLALGGTEVIAQTIKGRMPQSTLVSIQQKIESILYETYFENSLPGLRQLVGTMIQPKVINSYYARINRVNGLNLDIATRLSRSLLPARSIRIMTSSQKDFYFDAYARGFFPFGSVPHCKDISISNTKSYVEKTIIDRKSPFIMLCAQPEIGRTEVLAALCSIFGAPFVINPPLEIRITSENKSDEETMRILRPAQKVDFIAGLWPSIDGGVGPNQRLSIDSGFKQLRHELIWEQLFIAEGRISFTQTVTSELVTLRSGVIRNYTHGADKLYIVTNIPKKEASIADIAKAYFRRWPDYDRAFQHM